MIVVTMVIAFYYRKSCIIIFPCCLLCASQRNSFIIEGVITLLIAIILFFKPVDTLITIVKILAIAFIVIGALFIAGAILYIVRKSRNPEAEVGEAEVVEEKSEDGKD